MRKLSFLMVIIVMIAFATNLSAQCCKKTKVVNAKQETVDKCEKVDDNCKNEKEISQKKNDKKCNEDKLIKKSNCCEKTTATDNKCNKIKETNGCKDKDSNNLHKCSNDKSADNCKDIEK